MPFLIQIIVALCIVGLFLWVVGQIPMDATIARIIRVVVIVAVCLWLLNILFGLSGGGGYLFGPPVRTR
jgi:low temperature requirement protein LtrA